MNQNNRTARSLYRGQRIKKQSDTQEAKMIIIEQQNTKKSSKSPAKMPSSELSEKPRKVPAFLKFAQTSKILNQANSSIAQENSYVSQQSNDNNQSSCNISNYREQYHEDSSNFEQQFIQIDGFYEKQKGLESDNGAYQSEDQDGDEKNLLFIEEQKSGDDSSYINQSKASHRQYDFHTNDGNKHQSQSDKKRNFSKIESNDQTKEKQKILIKGLEKVVSQRLPHIEENKSEDEDQIHEGKSCTPQKSFSNQKGKSINKHIKLSENEQLMLDQIYSNSEDIFIDLKTLLSSKDSTESDFIKEFKLEYLTDNTRFIIANPICCAVDIDLSSVLYQSHVMQKLAKEQYNQLISQVINYTKSHEYLREFKEIPNILNILKTLPLKSSLWLLEVIIISYQEENHLQHGADNYRSYLREVYNKISKWSFKKTDYCLDQHSKYPGIPVGPPLTFQQFIQQHDQFNSLKIFGNGREFSLDPSSNKFKDIRICFLKVLNLSSEEILKEIAYLINNYRLLIIIVFQYFYQTTDLSSSRKNEQINKMYLSKEVKIFSIYVWLFRGVFSYFNTKVTTHHLNQLQQQDENSLLLIFDKMGSWLCPSFHKSFIVDSLNQEAYNPNGVSIWGDFQLPKESQFSKLLAYEIKAVTLFHLNKIHTIFNNAIKSSLLKERFQADQAIQEKIKPQKILTQKQISIENKIKWFSTLLQKSCDTKSQLSEERITFKVYATSPNIDGLYRDLALTLLNKQEPGPGTFFAYMAKILTDDSSQRGEDLVQKLELECSVNGHGTINSLFKQAMEAFIYIPEIFKPPIMKWISHTSQNLKPSIVQQFLKDQYSSKIPYPLSWISLVDHDYNSIFMILQSNNIDISLMGVCQSSFQRIEELKITEILHLFNECDLLARWILGVYNQQFFEKIKDLIKQNHLKFRQIAVMVNRKLDKEQKTHKLQPDLFSEMLEKYINNKIQLEHFESEQSGEWPNILVKSLQKDMYDDPFLPKVKDQSHKHLTPEDLEIIERILKNHFTDRICQKCLPQDMHIVPRDWQKYVTAVNVHAVINIKHKKWILNGVATGCGKSLLISFLAHHLASNSRVIVITCNKFLQNQLQYNYFDQSHDNVSNILHFSSSSKEFFDFVTGQSLQLDDVRKSYVIVDEFDYFAGNNRLIFKYLQPQQKNLQQIISFDMIQTLTCFKKVIAFSSKFPKSIVSAINSVDSESGILHLDFGELKGSGSQTYLDPKWLFRSNLQHQTFVEDTLNLILKVLGSKDPPRCLYIILNEVEQVINLENYLKSTNKKICGKRKIIRLTDLDDVNIWTEFQIKTKDLANYENGFIFITHCDANRGVSIKGIEPACVIANYRFSSGADLDQALGRGNRSMDSKSSSKTYVFIDKGMHEENIISMIQNSNQVLTEEQKHLKQFFKVFHGLVLNQPMIIKDREEIRNFTTKLNSLIGYQDKKIFLKMLEIFIQLIKDANLDLADSGPSGKSSMKASIDKKNIEELYQQGEYKNIGKTLKYNQFSDLVELINRSSVTLGFHYVSISLLQRASACAFPIYSQEKEYKTDQLIQLIKNSFRDAKQLKRFILFCKGSQAIEVDKEQISDEIMQVLPSYEKYIF